MIPNPIPPFIPIPLYVSTRIDLVAGLDGEVFAGLESDVTAKQVGTSGLVYECDEEPAWGPIASVKRTLSGAKSKATLTGRVKGYLGPEVGLFLYGAAGPKLTLHGYSLLQADLQGKPCLQLFGGLQCKAGAEMKVMSYSSPSTSGRSST